MTTSQQSRLLAIFQKRIAGDDALLELARLRFREAGSGAELYATNHAELEWLLNFKPRPDAPLVVHLPREINLFNPEGRGMVTRFAAGFAKRVDRFVVHDQIEISNRFEDYLTVLAGIDDDLQSMPFRPRLFVEYAAGLDPALFVDLHERIKDLRQVCACIDIGHLGIYFIRQAYRRSRPGEDICALDPANPRLPALMEEVQAAVDNALPPLLPVVRHLAGLGKPLHFHLHDGHPLSTFSPFGVSDHLSFSEKIALPFSFRGKKEIPTMFGPGGLAKIIAASGAGLAANRHTYTLEIHPGAGRLPLGNVSYLFDHWRDKTNAEKMNRWLSVLLSNYALLAEIFEGLRL